MPDGSVVDTVVLRYFLLVEKAELLADLLPPPRLIPTAVYDPGDASGARGSLSEISESVRYQRAMAADRRLGDDDRAAAARRAELLGAALSLAGFETASLETAEERELFVRLTSTPGDFGLVLPLGSGESACIAMGVERGLCVVTDDNDALRALDHVAPGHPYERIRKLLERGVEERLIAKQEANLLHMAMTAEGFRDVTVPFPPRAKKTVAKKRTPPRRR